MLLLIGAPAGADPVDEELYEAVVYADAVAARAAIERGADPNFQRNGRGLLGWAAQGGVPEMVSLLIESGADLDAVDGVDQTPLMRAIEVMDPAIATLLLDAGADPNVETPDGRTAAMMAVEQGDLALAKALAKANADFSRADVNGDTAAWKLVQYRPEGMLEMVAFLGSVGVDMNQASGGYTPLYWAVEQDDAALAKALLEAGADPNTKAGNQQVPLNASASNPEIMRLLLEAGADPNLTNRWGENALYNAIEYASTDDLKLLIDAGADLNHTTDGGQTPLGRAEALNRSEMIDFIKDQLGMSNEAPQQPVAAEAARQSQGGADEEFGAMPKLGHLSSMSSTGGGVTYFSSATVSELNQFYAEQLSNAGWQLLSQNTDGAMYTSNSYQRGDQVLTFSLGADRSGDPPQVMVSLVPVGSMSAANVPRYADTEITFESPATAIYMTSDDLTQVGDQTFSLLQQDGWQGAVTVKNADMQIMELTKDGSKLSVFVSKAPAQGNKTSIQYSLSKAN
jgi:ankyrin repeat protein